MNERIKLTVHDGLHISGFRAGAQILDQLVGLKDVGTDLITPGDFAFFAVKFLLLAAFLVFYFLKKAGFEGNPTIWSCGSTL